MERERKKKQERGKESIDPVVVCVLCFFFPIEQVLCDALFSLNAIYGATYIYIILYKGAYILYSYGYIDTKTKKLQAAVLSPVVYWSKLSLCELQKGKQ